MACTHPDDLSYCVSFDIEGEIRWCRGCGAISGWTPYFKPNLTDGWQVPDGVPVNDEELRANLKAAGIGDIVFDENLNRIKE
jgi:hypothetical protein